MFISGDVCTFFLFSLKTMTGDVDDENNGRFFFTGNSPL